MKSDRLGMKCILLCRRSKFFTLTLCMLGKKISRRHFEVFFLFFLENRISHFMQIVFLYITALINSNMGIHLKSFGFNFPSFVRSVFDDVFFSAVISCQYNVIWYLGRALFVLRFYGPVNPMGSCRARSVYLTTRLLGRLSPLSG